MNAITRSLLFWKSCAPIGVGLLLLTALYSLVALVFGWGMGTDFLIHSDQMGKALVPATALSFLLSSAAMGAAFGGRVTLARGLCIAVAALVFTTAVAQAQDWQGPAGLFVIALEPGERMSSATVVGFAMLTFAIHQLALGRLILVEGIAVLGLSSAAAVVLVDLDDGGYLTDLPYLSGMSLQAAVLFACLFLALCQVPPDGVGSRQDRN